MSNIGSGTPTSGYENLSALLEFVKSPDYLERIKELRDLEDSSRKASDQAKMDIADAAAKTSALAAAQKEHADRVTKFISDRAAHDRRVKLWNKAMIGVQKAMSGEDF